MPKSTLRKSAETTSLLFYSFPPALIAEWCQITYQQATRLKRGECTPPKGTWRLFQLYSKHQVLTPEFRGWRVVGNKIIDPEGNATTAGQLRAYALMMQLMAELTRDDQAKRDRFREILEVANG